MSSTSSKTTSRLAQFISRRIHELRPRRSQLEIATAAGFGSSKNMLAMIKSGSAKLPLDRVPALAAALECDVADLARLALAEIYEPAVLEMILGLAETHQTSRELDTVAEWSSELEIELRAAQRDVKFAGQFAKSAISRAGQAHARLVRVRSSLDDLIVAARTPGAMLKVK